MILNASGASVATYTYQEGGRIQNMRSQLVDGVLSTLIWDGDNYLGLKD